MKQLICVIGGNEIASTIASTLFQSGFPVVISADEKENLLRHHLSFGDAIYQGSKTINSVTASLLSDEQLAESPTLSIEEKLKESIQFILQDRRLPLIHQLDLDWLLEALQPTVIVNTITEPLEALSLISMAPLVIGLQTLHTPGKDCHLAISSANSWQLGEIVSPDNTAEPPSNDAHFFNDPFAYCHTPLEGLWVSTKSNGEMVSQNESLGKIDNIEIRSPFDGQIWGIARSGRFLAARSSVAMIFQGSGDDAYRKVGYRENAIANATLQAIMRYGQPGEKSKENQTD